MERHVATACRAVEAVIGAPTYTITNTDDLARLSDAEHRYVFSPGNEAVVAFTSPVADLLFRESLKYRWRGRGCCVVFRQSPLGMTNRRCLGVMIHEAAHWLADATEPCRDDKDHKRALESFWGSLRTQEEHHGNAWLRAVVNLWMRVAAQGHAVGLGDCLSLEQYGFGRADVAPLLIEAERRRDEPIEAVLADPPRSRSPRTKQLRRKRGRPATRYATSPVGTIAIRPDGSVETGSQLDGTPGRRYASLSDFSRAVA